MSLQDLYDRKIRADQILEIESEIWNQIKQSQPLDFLGHESSIVLIETKSADGLCYLINEKLLKLLDCDYAITVWSERDYVTISSRKYHVANLTSKYNGVADGDEGLFQMSADLKLALGL